MYWKNLVFLDLNLLNQKCSLFSLAKAILKRSMGSQWGFFLILTTLTLTDLAQSQSIHVSMNPVPVGANVTISSDAEVTLGAWMFHGSLLVLIYPGGYVINKEKSDRIIFISNTSSLTLQSVRQEDSGLYKIEQINGFSFQIELSVQVPISGVGLSAKTTDLVEFNSTAVLMCSVSNGTFLSYEWLVGNSTISNGADVQLSNGNATISIAGLTRFDQGPYRCNVSNGLGYELSPPLNLNISYGPSNTTMTVTPMKNIYKSGSNITLSCSTDSKPTAKIQWMFNEKHLNQSGSELDLQNVQESHSGTYKCVFHNPVTKRFSSNSSKIQVMDPITAVVLNHTDGPAILDKVYSLQCQVTGPVGSIQWWKDGHPIAPDSRMVFEMNNSTLTFNPVQYSDGGLYDCHAFNSVSNMTSSSFAVEINYGPTNTTMTVMPVKNIYRSGSNITLSCSTDSKPTAKIQWMLNKVPLNHSSSWLHLQNVQEHDSGSYKCVFYNNITMRSSLESTEIHVMDPLTVVALNHSRGPAILDMMYTLQCEVTGPIGSIEWWKDGRPLVPDNRTVFKMDNSTLILNPVQHSDGGVYYCHVFNDVSNMSSSPFEVKVNYGPEMPTIMGPRVASTEDSVTLTCWAESVPPSSFKWFFNDSLVSNMSEYMTPALTVEMSGEYICMAFNSITGKNSTASTMLTVIDPITNVQVEAHTNHPVEGHPYDITCSVNGTVDHIYWMKNKEKMYPDNRTLFLMDNMTLRFMNIQRNDTGHYQCMAINALGNMTSSPVMLIVNYGPEMPTIMGPRVAPTEDSVTLTCWAKSVPPSSFKWFFNDSLVSNMSEYMTPALTVEMSGEYICMAFNSITGKNSTASTMLTVIDPITNVQVEDHMNHPVEGHPFDLTCSVNGTVDHIYWMKNKEKMYPDNRTLFLMDNMTVRFINIQQNDTGHYQCMAINALGNMTSSPMMLIVNYGPEMPTIMGPREAQAEDSATLTCRAESVPPSSFKWFFNDSLVSNMSEYMTPALTVEMSGEYICMAFNSITGKNSTASTMLTVIDPIVNVTIDTSNSWALESYSYEMICDVTGTVGHIYWIKNGEKLHPDNSIVFSMDNKTIMFKPLDRHDAGHYQCMATNSFGNMTSTAYMLSVTFGPDRPVIYGSEFGEKGRDVVFNCSATSMPPSTYTWWFNGSFAANTSEFTAGPLFYNMSGKYTCMAHNQATGKNSTNSIMLTVIEAIESVVIQSNTTPINNENFTLTCHIVGPYDTIYWMKDDMKLDMNVSDTDSYMYTVDNMLHFTPLAIDNNGTYQCVATNRAAHHKSPPYTLLVNYGPLNVTISGPDTAKDGASVSLICSADSQPECDFHWFLDNQTTPYMNGSVINFTATRGHTGKYICIATNPVTNITMMQSKDFAIADHASAICIQGKGALLLLGLYPFLAHFLFL